jgi:hypothetical protein
MLAWSKRRSKQLCDWAGIERNVSHLDDVDCYEMETSCV